MTVDLSNLDAEEKVIIAEDNGGDCAVFLHKGAQIRFSDADPPAKALVLGVGIENTGNRLDWDNFTRDQSPNDSDFEHGWYAVPDKIELCEAQDLDAWPPGPDWPDWVPEEVRERVGRHGVREICDLAPDHVWGRAVAVLSKTGGIWTVIRDDGGENFAEHPVAAEEITGDSPLTDLFGDSEQ